MFSLRIASKPATIIKIEPALQETEADWEPQYLETVLYYNEDLHAYRLGIFVALWNATRGLRDEFDDREGSYFEASPYHFECQPETMVIRARVIDMESGFGQFADISTIVEHCIGNIESAYGFNQAVA